MQGMPKHLYNTYICYFVYLFICYFVYLLFGIVCMRGFQVALHPWGTLGGRGVGRGGGFPLLCPAFLGGFSAALHHLLIAEDIPVDMT
jgi:hypothetical protein